MNGTWLNIAMAVVVAALASPPAAATDALKDARDLYAAAEYERALGLLDQLPVDVGSDRIVPEYRAYCLLALGRAAEAEQAIAAVVVAEPMYRPSGADVSPRVQAAFSDVRRRLLPGIIQRQYAAAKAVFDARDFLQARDAFDEVLTALADSDVAGVASQPPLSDLRTLAAGFRELSAEAAVPPPIPARIEAPILTAVTVPPPRTYGVEDAGVTPPTPLLQRLPTFTIRGPMPAPGVLDLLIDERGAVARASMRVPIDPRYDLQLVAAARQWTFTPATLDGAPVKFHKLVQIAVAARQ